MFFVFLDSLHLANACLSCVFVCFFVCYRVCFLSGLPQVLASQLLLVDEVMKAGKQMGQAPPGGPAGAGMLE